MTQIVKDFCGCDFVVRLDEARRGTPIRLLQVTDMQIIDAEQRRTPDRLRPDEIAAWKPDLMDAQFGDHMKSLIAQTSPDLIFMTGDLVYGSFDDSGSTFEWFCKTMDSFKIPWAPVFGNHDNESAKGVLWQCAQLENSAYCTFRRGCVTGNGNYSVGIAVGDTLVRVLYMLDSNGCRAASDPLVTKERGIFADQFSFVSESAEKIRASQGKTVPSFLAFHIPTKEFDDAEREKGYRTDENSCFTIGVDVPAKDGDFGCNYNRYQHFAKTEGDFLALLQKCSADGVFVGHCHTNNSVISHRGVRYVYGLKTGQYDYHIPGQMGGTLVRLEGERFEVSHVHALVPFSPFPGRANFFSDFFAKPDDVR